ncbi:MAG: hypothetical protein OEZ06_32295 [Myxococcales bacterium]|nr:hypothetical protein [Myxococcales bacterium]
MHTSLADAVEGRPWSLAGVVRDLELIHDDEGRPLSERRAPSVAKVGVPMVLKPCPYPDERRGVEMNVSALAQITRYLDPVQAEIAGFVAAHPDAEPSWRRVFAAVVDQLAGPAVHLLRARDTRGPVPALRGVGHKLAAGFYGVVRGLLLQAARGQAPTASVKATMDFVHAQKSLIGASEACAGPPNMIERATEVLVLGNHAAPEAIDEPRLRVAMVLAEQMAIGGSWELFDAQQARTMLLGELPRDQLNPRNFFIEQNLDRWLDELKTAPAADESIDYATLIPATESRLLTLLGGDAARHPIEDDAALDLAALYDHGEGAIRLLNDDGKMRLARRAVHCLRAYRELLAALVRKELELRECLGYAAEVGVKFETTVLPPSKTIKFFEAALGHRLECTPATEPALVLRNHRRSLVLP